MSFTPPVCGDQVLFHQRRPALDATATVSAVDGSQVSLSGDGFTASSVDHITMVGDPAAAAAYWTYGDERDGIPPGDDIGLD